MEDVEEVEERLQEADVVKEFVGTRSSLFRIATAEYDKTLR